MMRVASFLWIMVGVLAVIFGSPDQEIPPVVIVIFLGCIAMSTLCLGIQMLLQAIERNAQPKAIDPWASREH